MTHGLLATRHVRPSALSLLTVSLAAASCLVGLPAIAEEAAPAAPAPAAPAPAEPAPAESAPAEPRDATAPARAESAEPGYLERRWAGTDLTALAAALTAWRRDNGSWPADCPGAAAATLRPTPTKDPWGSPYTCVLDEPPRVVSLGPDRQLGSADDVAYRLDGGGPMPSAPGAKDKTGEPAAAPASTGAPASNAPAPPATDEAKATTDRLVWMARALAAYRAREGRYPVADQAEHLEHWLVPTDLPPSQWFATDGWDRPWRYRVTDTGSSYSLSSGGADGRWDALASTTPAPAANADGDLLVADGVFLRWPADFRPQALAGTSAGAGEKAATKEPQEPAAKTAWRLEQLVAHLERARAANGRYPEADDAARLFAELGAKISPTDGWGRELDYLSQSGGRHFALASRGKDGRLAHSMEQYAHGAAASGDDVVIRR